VNQERSGPRTLAIVLNRDLMFGSRMRSALASLELAARFVKSTDELTEVLGSDAAEAALVIIDMNVPIDWPAVEQAIGGASDPPPTLAFGPHVDVESRRAAKAAGITRIVSNGQFHREMADLIARYRRS
jgi:hypothetical protein